MPATRFNHHTAPMPPLSPPTSPVHDQATAPPSTYFTERKNPRRTPYTSNRVIPSLRREDRVFNSIDGDGGKLGLMVLESMGIEMRDESSVESQNEDLGAIKVPGMKAGWMVMGVGDDNGSQFTDTQGSSMNPSQFNFSQTASQDTGFTLQPFTSPSHPRGIISIPPTLRETSPTPTRPQIANSSSRMTRGRLLRGIPTTRPSGANAGARERSGLPGGGGGSLAHMLEDVE